MSDDTREIILETRGLTKHYGGVEANQPLFVKLPVSNSVQAEASFSMVKRYISMALSMRGKRVSKPCFKHWH